MPGERVLDPETRLQHARDAAWAALNRRDHTVAQMRDLLTRKRVEPEIIQSVLAEMVDGDWLDDARFAQRFAEDRRNLDGWGPERIARRLRSMGVDSEHVAAAVGERGHQDEIEAAIDLLRRRFPAPPTDVREAHRAFGMLVRKGFGVEMAHDALRRHAGVGEFDGS